MCTRTHTPLLDAYADAHTDTHTHKHTHTHTSPLFISSSNYASYVLEAICPVQWKRNRLFFQGFGGGSGSRRALALWHVEAEAFFSKEGHVEAEAEPHLFLKK